MGEIRVLIESATVALEENKEKIRQQIQELVAKSSQIVEADRFLFHIDDRSFYFTCFHAFSKNKELTEDELETPDILADAVSIAYEIGTDAEGESVEDIFEEMNDRLVNLIAEGWKQAGGNNLKQPAFIYFHDTCYYYDIERDEWIEEDNLPFK